MNKSQLNNSATSINDNTSSQDAKNAPNGVNVKVVVRCRPPNEAEKGFPLIIRHEDIKKNEITVHLKLHGKELLKTFSFDHVFGGTTTQKDIFEAVAMPIVNEVLAGYNCTIFAYGQTSTGKTYTMEGFRNPILDTTIIDSRAGIVPRSIHHIFDTLDSINAEYTIKVTCLELYNEELQDLLTTEKRQLRIFDDQTGRKGTVVSGLEEVVVTDASQILTVLDTAQKKRQSAETNMNKNSSRSHVITTITIHLKETTVDGEELIKTGKLNLVDLAGSENVSRSGALNKRAKEAGMINQSLLTLGRVITALTEHGPHIPYRESKLTRLLQDSLGGKTRTCIIATVSPSIMNMEETMSTLDYSTRAKSIRNKPELNMKISKAALIRELNTDMEKLKLELQNQRAKNGVYMSVEQHQELLQQITNLNQELADLRAENKVSKEDLDELTRQLIEKKNRLDQEITDHENTRTILQGTLEKLAQTESDLAESQIDVAERQYVISEQQKAEKILYGQATTTVETLKESYGEIEMLEAKIDRKSKIEAENLHTIELFQINMNESITRAEGNINQFKDIYGSIQANLTQTISSFVADKTRNIVNVQNQLQQLLNCYTDTTKKIYELVEGRVAQNTDNINTIANKHDHHSQTVIENLTKLQETFAQAINTVKEQLFTYQYELVNMNNFIVSSVNRHNHSVNEFVMDHGKLMASLRDNVSKSSESQIAALQVYQNNFHQMFLKQRKTNADMKESFLRSIQSLLEDNLRMQDNELNDRIADVNRFVESAVSDVVNFRGIVNSNADHANQRVDTLSKHLISVTEEMGNDATVTSTKIKNAIDSTLASVDNISAMVYTNTINLSQDIREHGHCVGRILNAERDQFATFTDTFTTTARDQKQQYTNNQQDLVQNVRVFDQTILDGFVSNNNASITQVTNEVSSFTLQQGSFNTAHRSDIAYLVKNFKTDCTSGSTPKKRKRDATTELTRSRPFEELCSEFRASLVDNSEKENVAGNIVQQAAGLTIDSDLVSKSSRSSTPSESSPVVHSTPKKILFSSTPVSASKNKRRKIGPSNVSTANNTTAPQSKLKRTLSNASTTATYSFR
jgi:kinesin family protein 11